MTTPARAPASAATLTAVDLLDALAEIRERAADVLRWHVPARHGGRNPRGRRGTPLCTECGFPWPCRTATRLTGGDPE